MLCSAEHIWAFLQVQLSHFPYRKGRHPWNDRGEWTYQKMGVEGVISLLDMFLQTPGHFAVCQMSGSCPSLLFPVPCKPSWICLFAKNMWIIHTKAHFVDCYHVLLSSRASRQHQHHKIQYEVCHSCVWDRLKFSKIIKILGGRVP